MRRTSLLLAIIALAAPSTASARGGDYVFKDDYTRQFSTPEAVAQAQLTVQQAEAAVKEALVASRFNWSRVSRQVTIRLADCGCAGADPGEISLDPKAITNNLYGPRGYWGIIQHEYAHQVDFFLLTRRSRRHIRALLGGQDWCYENSSLGHFDHGCERFADTLAWAYWPSPDNITQSHWRTGIQPLTRRQFRHWLNRLLARPGMTQTVIPSESTVPTALR